jgi:hypothetical protein
MFVWCFLSNSGYNKASNERAIEEWRTGNNEEGSGRGLTYEIYLERLRKTKKPQSGQSVSRPRFESGTFRIRSRSANHSTTTFGGYRVIVVNTICAHIYNRGTCNGARLSYILRECHVPVFNLLLAPLNQICLNKKCNVHSLSLQTSLFSYRSPIWNYCTDTVSSLLSDSENHRAYIQLLK